jgi:2-polyprenyl-3-methyl-5-hydroxy-6-metoxy-1,4-benzoquinol methylase
MAFNSSKYWEERYKNGGNSGQGSYNALAKFKASVINEFIQTNNIKSIIDYGVGDGNQLALINTSAIIYYGIDISETIIQMCKDKFKNNVTKQFFLVNEFDINTKAELVLSCDVLYHLIEESVYYNYIYELFNRSSKYVIIYAKDANLNHTAHVKFRKFTDYIKTSLKEFRLINHIPNKFPQNSIGHNNSTTSPSDFYMYEKI